MKENIEVTFDGGKVITAHINGHSIRTDQPLDNGGGNTAPAPFELFMASIGTCAGIYVKSFCDRRQIPTDGIRIIQTMDFDEVKKVPGVISLDIQLPVEFPGKYREAVVNAAELCLVKKTISSQPEFKVITTQKQ
jgi:ribosomal protein S12 methylthiotransferase accessory factor